MAEPKKTIVDKETKRKGEVQVYMPDPLRSIGKEIRTKPKRVERTNVAMDNPTPIQNADSDNINV